MKLTSRGFTLVELMIVIAIIGILAAALFPSMTGYLKRSRDTARISHLKDITSALGAYYSDNEAYPTMPAVAGTAGSITGALLSTNYLPKGVPVDPTSSVRNNGCWPQQANANYCYGKGTIASAPAYAVSAVLENENGGNTGGTITGSLFLYVNSGAFVYAASPTLTKGSGSGYVLVN